MEIGKQYRVGTIDTSDWLYHSGMLMLQGEVVEVFAIYHSDRCEVRHKSRRGWTIYNKDLHPTSKRWR